MVSTVEIMVVTDKHTMEDRRLLVRVEASGLEWEQEEYWDISLVDRG